MTVAELIEKLKTMPQELEVDVGCESEGIQWKLLERDIKVQDEFETGRKILVIS